VKIPQSIRVAYESQREECSRLRDLVDKRIVAIKLESWHYQSRLKGEESFALKVESGRFPNPSQMEDLLACWLVVENQTQVLAAEELVRSVCDVVRRRPRDDRRTHKKPEAFPFDDLRLYVHLKDDPAMPSSGLSHVLFEVQVKTFLQHAWAIATHDLVYKADQANWSSQRIAYQVKAMLEHAEVSIAEAEVLSKSGGLAKTDSNTADTLEVMQVLRAFWSSDRLPSDMLRLAGNVLTLLKALGMTIVVLRRYLQTETDAGRGAALENVSPFGAIVQTLMNQDENSIVKFLTEADHHDDFRLLVPKELDVPQSILGVKTDRLIPI
jgi:ppGpp synthetase/RelA/SpoT-type nucleotidyltranferase